ncbi:hypothetical protein E8E13_001493 [Curvularia kusanoi]|uniref:Uncharacterized protein n=1 Tax=Curvularia kusanoi TaxID=90978 RepID=A0A9P4W1T4_CURKU|nr:hypothetical protein E8E13_001493 [Curvularia kusanoi]
MQLPLLLLAATALTALAGPTTTTITRTSTITVPALESTQTIPSDIAGTPASTPAASPSTNYVIGTGKPAVCISLKDLLGDGILVAVADFTSDSYACAPSPRFAGFPLTLIVESTSPVEPSNRSLPTRTDTPLPSFSLFRPGAHHPVGEYDSEPAFSAS